MLKSEGDLTDQQHKTETGHRVYYDSLGNKESEGDYTDGRRAGLWRFYFPGTARISFEQEFQNHVANGIQRFYDLKTGLLRFEGRMEAGERSGPCTQYYTGTHSPYRTGTYKWGVRHGTFNTYHRNGVLKRLEHYDLGKMQEGGKCFDSSGRPVRYTPFIVDPVYMFDLDGLLTKEVYDRKKRSGEVFLDYTNLRFIISKNGEVSDLRFYCNPCPNEELIRAFVKGLAKWKPMIIDRYPVAAEADCKIIVWEKGARIDLSFSPAGDFLAQE